MQEQNESSLHLSAVLTRFTTSNLSVSII